MHGVQSIHYDSIPGSCVHSWIPTIRTMVTTPEKSTVDRFDPSKQLVFFQAPTGMQDTELLGQICWCFSIVEILNLTHLEDGFFLTHQFITRYTNTVRGRRFILG